MENAMNNIEVKPRIYLDNASTTKPLRYVMDAVNDAVYEQYGNPSSLHDIGRKANEAVEKARNGEFDEADELIKKGESELTNAHNAQTELLAKEAQGKDIEYSIMLVHAQDHLMTTIMYERVAKEFITLYKEKLS